MSSGALGCPRCGGSMTAIAGDAGRALGCERCGGAWLDHERFGAVRQHEDTFVRRVVDELGARAPEAHRELSLPARCPLCATVMSRTLVSCVELDFCSEHGAWFDRGELAAVAEVVAALRAGSARAEPSLAARTARVEAHPDPAPESSSAAMLGDAALRTAGAVGSILLVVVDVLHYGDFRCCHH